MHYIQPIHSKFASATNSSTIPHLLAGSPPLNQRKQLIIYSSPAYIKSSIYTHQRNEGNLNPRSKSHDDVMRLQRVDHQPRGCALWSSVCDGQTRPLWSCVSGRILIHHNHVNPGWAKSLVRTRRLIMISRDEEIARRAKPRRPARSISGLIVSVLPRSDEHASTNDLMPS